MLELDKNFKAAIVTMLKYIEENMLIMNEKIQNISRKRNFFFSNDILELKNNTWNKKWTYKQNGDDRKSSVNLKIDS